MHKFLNDIDSFLKGYKPALLYNPCAKYPIYKPEQLEKLKKTYPFLKDSQQTGMELYFQTDEAKADFFERVKNLKLGSPEFQRVLGMALGFPPKAVDFYVRNLENPELDWKKVGLAYCGISCAGSIDDITENVQWFWELDILEDEFRDVSLTYGAIDPVVTYHIGYKCHEDLRRAEEELQMIAHKRKTLVAWRNGSPAIE